MYDEKVEGHGVLRLLSSTYSSSSLLWFTYHVHPFLTHKDVLWLLFYLVGLLYVLTGSP